MGENEQIETNGLKLKHMRNTSAAVKEQRKYDINNKCINARLSSSKHTKTGKTSLAIMQQR